MFVVIFDIILRNILRPRAPFLYVYMYIHVTTFLLNMHVLPVAQSTENFVWPVIMKERVMLSCRPTRQVCYHDDVFVLPHNMEMDIAFPQPMCFEEVVEHELAPFPQSTASSIR